MKHIGVFRSAASWPLLHLNRIDALTVIQSSWKTFVLVDPWLKMASCLKMASKLFIESESFDFA